MLTDAEMLKVEADLNLPLPSGETRSCEICGRFVTGLKLHHDHDHATGNYRGWLCNDCNLGLGRFKDNPALLIAAIVYLKRCGIQLEVYET